ncbi:MAG: hypothetical protein ACPIOQ_31095, partial [Promethearchaeia archaeon]
RPRDRLSVWQISSLLRGKQPAGAGPSKSLDHQADRGAPLPPAACFGPTSAQDGGCKQKPGGNAEEARQKMLATV